MSTQLVAHNILSIHQQKAKLMKQNIRHGKIYIFTTFIIRHNNDWEKVLPSRSATSSDKSWTYFYSAQNNCTLTEHGYNGERMQNA